MGAGEPAPERVVRYRWAAGVAGGLRVLDAACGAGWGTATLAETAAAAVGVDLSPGAIATARRERGSAAEFVEGDLRRLPFASGEFDLATCFEALAHLTEPEAALGELHRVLGPGGTLLVSAPNPAIYPAGNPLHLSETTPAELERLLRKRFANVAVHWQQTYFASLLGSSDLLARADPGAEISVRAIKLAGGAPEGALHAIAAASDGELPPPPAWLALGEDSAYEERQQPLREWQERAIRAEAEACALERKVREI